MSNSDEVNGRLQWLEDKIEELEKSLSDKNRMINGLLNDVYYLKDNVSTLEYKVNDLERSK
jgi:predicted nuclease with TOPRIM domain